MFFSKLVLFTISLVAISVLATPHALHHHALHRRVVAARVASANSNPSNVTARRRSSPKCAQHSDQHSAQPSAQHSAQSSPPVAHSAPPSTSPVAIVHHTPPPVTTPTPTATPPQQHPTTTSTSRPPQSTSGSSGPSIPGTSGGPFKGQGTFYATGLGACGITSKDSDLIAAVSEELFDSFPGYDGDNPNKNPICGLTITATRNGVSVTITVVDRCTGCARFDLDFSPAAFNHLADPAEGRVDITWNWDQ